MSWFSSYPERSVRDIRDEYDYIIVGGGTAGCVLASRLTEDPSISVLLVERGSLKAGWLSRIPLLSSHFASDGSSTRIVTSTPQEHVNGRSFPIAGGNSLGGASKINAMLYTRGLPGEYNAWSQAGREGWSYGEIQPYFIKSETDLDQDPQASQSIHGVAGPWKNRSYSKAYWGHTAPIIEASKALGVPYVDDLNSPLHPSHGCAKMHFNIDASGRRSSALTGFLPPDLVTQRQGHLHICTNTMVLRIDIQHGEKGLKAEGVTIQSREHNAHSPSRFIRARREVILSAGPIISPQLLMLSGVGPAEHLKEHDIPVMKDLPNVGSHLQDHLGVALQYRVPLHDSVARLQAQPWSIIKEFFLWLFFGMGLLLGPVLELSVFVQTRLFDSNFRTVTPTPTDEDSSLPMNLPDIEIMPIAWSDAATAKAKRNGGLAFLVVILRPQSTGTVRLASSDPRADPLVDPAYLSSTHDRAVLRQGLRFGLRLGEQTAAQGYPIAPHLIPPSEGDEDMDRFVRDEAQTTYHYSSTCRMAPEVEGSTMGGVVDDRLRVHGVQGLRIADSSVFPHILSTHLTAATVAVAEKCADMIKQDHSSDE